MLHVVPALSHSHSALRRHNVDEILVVDSEQQKVHWLTLADGDYKPTRQSRLIELGAAELETTIRWPAGGQG